MATELTMITDNTGFRVYGPNTTISPWISLQGDMMYKGTSWYALDPGSFLFFFQGTSIAFFGTVPSSPSQRPTVTIDNEMNFSTEIFHDPPGFRSTYRQWFQSPTLVDGFHVISVLNCSNGTNLDFTVVKVGTQTNLTQSTIVVDNESPSIFYSGHWSRDTRLFTSGTDLKGYPYGNSTHRSSTPGDFFRFRFTGASISVYGTFLLSNLGVLAATFTLDGATIPQIHNITSQTVEHQESPNFLHFSLDNLSPGDHTLIVNVTMAKNQTFVLDYITYNPSFETSLKMPLLDNTTPTTTSGTIKSSTPLGSPTSQTSQVQTPGLLPIVVILGVVTGVLTLLLLAILGRWLFQRRGKPRIPDEPSPYLYEYNHHQPDNDANNQHIQRKAQWHIPQLQPLPSVPQGPRPLKFMQATDSHTRPVPDQPPEIDIRPRVTDSNVAAIPPPY